MDAKTTNKKIRIGEKFIIEVADKGLSGYKWNVNMNDETIIGVKNKGTSKRDSDDEVGGSGVVNFEVEGLKKGKVTLQLSLSREWETGSPPIENRIYEIVVK